MTAFDLGLYEPVVSTEAVAEVERNLIEDFPAPRPCRTSSSGRPHVQSARRPTHRPRLG
ncbi:MAG: hypothetical protein M5U19_02595 [Microthrixaceae bacterium]|nr:hypothetical protein [Microthrixaceae bacterium]